jgi:hypothetical protein
VNGKVVVRQVDPELVDRVNIEGTELPAAQSLNRWIERLGGYDGELTDPSGRRHTVSLQQWREADPETTWLQVTFEYET